MGEYYDGFGGTNPNTKSKRNMTSKEKDVKIYNLERENRELKERIKELEITMFQDLGR